MKIVSFLVTEEQHAALHQAASVARLTVGEFMELAATTLAATYGVDFPRGTLGALDSQYRDAIGVEALAQMHNVSEKTIRRILRNEKRRAATFPGACYEGEGERGTWWIPLTEAKAWKPLRRGRPKAV